VGCEALEEQTQHLSSYDELPPVIRGSVLLAIGSSFPEPATVNLAIALPVIGVLLAATVHFLVVARTGYRVTTAEAATMLVAYLGFFTWVLAETFRLSNVIGAV